MTFVVSWKVRGNARWYAKKVEALSAPLAMRQVLEDASLAQHFASPEVTFVVERGAK